MSPILVYTRAACAPCKTLKFFLERKGIPFKEFPIEVSQFAMAPTVVVGQEVISGLNLRRLAELIG